MGTPVDRNAVRVAALKCLLRICAENADEPLPLPEEAQRALEAMVLDGDGERAMCSALSVSVDTVRAMLVRLAR